MTTSVAITGPFTAAMASEAGISRHRLRELVLGGLLRSDLHGVYVDASCPDSLDLRAREAALVLPRHAVVADRSAAWLHGVDALHSGERDVVPRLDAVSTGGKGRSVRNGVFGGKRDLIDDEVMELASGLRVTTPSRTACDIGRLCSVAIGRSPPSTSSVAVMHSRCSNSPRSCHACAATAASSNSAS